MKILLCYSLISIYLFTTFFFLVQVTLITPCNSSTDMSIRSATRVTVIYFIIIYFFSGIPSSLSGHCAVHTEHHHFRTTSAQLNDHRIYVRGTVVQVIGDNNEILKYNDETKLCCGTINVQGTVFSLGVHTVLSRDSVNSYTVTKIRHTAFIEPCCSRKKM